MRLIMPICSIWPSKSQRFGLLSLAYSSYLRLIPTWKIYKDTMFVQLGGKNINLSLFWVGGFTAKDPTEKTLLAVTAVLGIGATSRRRGLFCCDTWRWLLKGNQLFFLEMLWFLVWIIFFLNQDGIDCFECLWCLNDISCHWFVTLPVLNFQFPLEFLEESTHSDLPLTSKISANHLGMIYEFPPKN